MGRIVTDSTHSVLEDGKNLLSEQPLPTNTSSVEQRIDEILAKTIKRANDLDEFKDAKKLYLFSEAKQQLLSLIEEVIGEDEECQACKFDTAFSHKGENFIGNCPVEDENELRAEQRAKLKGVNHE